MSAIEIGCLHSPKGRTYRVKWNNKTREVFVAEPDGFLFPGSVIKCCAKASSASDAMKVAEAFVYNR